MMVKAQSKDGWVIYDHIIKVEHSTVNRFEPYYAREDTEDLCFHLAPDEIRPMLSITINLEDGKDRHILAWSPVFILNDVGRTVDRI
jgi:hypothetical protein